MSGSDVSAALDRVLGRVTMYRLVLIALGVIAAAALVLTLLPGQLFFGPLDLIASAAVLAAVSYLANRLFARLFRVHPHGESTLITAALLLFIFQPTAEPAGLGVLALAALLAVASKYLIAVRGRHVLNPAAFGAFAVGLLGLDFSVWWVGNPVLLPLVVVAAIAVLHRTRRMPLALVFIAVAATSLIAQAVLAGTPFGDAARTAFVSYAVVFFATFMLTEPLTLPPRRIHQLALAVVVGLLYATPFALPGPVFGPIELGLYSTPEFALLVGNVLAFALGQRRALRFEVAGRRQLTPTSWEVELQPSHPVRFRPGQYLELTVPHRGMDARGGRRTFSIASAPAPGGPVRLGLRVPPERSSSFKRALLELEPGASVTGTAVGGDFVLPADPAVPLLLVAGGIGITPFVSQLEAARAAGEQRDVVLVYAVSSTDEIAYAVELGRSGCRVLLVSPEPLTRMPEHWTWIGPGRLTGERLLAAVPDAGSRRPYLSGPPALIAELRPALRRAGARRIHTDAFVGY